MKKTNIYLLLLAMSLLFSWACKKEEYEPPMDENSHLFLTTNAGDFALDAIKYDTVALMDLSKGVEKRTWNFSGMNVDIIGSDNDVTNGNQVCKVRFFDDGEYDVPVSLTFKENVWVGTDQLQSRTFDTTIHVFIADSVRAAYTMEWILESEGVFSSEELDTIGELKKIWGGDQMRFVNQSTGQGLADFMIIRPDIDIVFTQADIADTFIYKFSSLGKYDVAMFAHSQYDNDFIYHSGLVEVTPSPRLVTIDALEVVDEDQEDGVDQIRMVFSRDIEDADAEDLIATLSINLDPQYSDPIPTTITSAVRDEELFNIFLLTLDQELYNTDLVQVSYDSSTSVLMSTDEKIVSGFDSVDVTFPHINLFAEQTDFDYDFEDNTAWFNAAWADPWDDGTVTAQATNVPAYSGDFSLRLVCPGGPDYDGFAAGPSTGSSWGGYETGVTMSFPAGDYAFGAWIYINQLGTEPPEGSNPHDLRLYMLTSSALHDAAGAILTSFAATSVVGQWVYVEALAYNFSSDELLVPMFRLQNAENTMAFDINVDHLEMYEVQIR